MAPETSFEQDVLALRAWRAVCFSGNPRRDIELIQPLGFRFKVSSPTRTVYVRGEAELLRTVRAW